MKNFVVLLCFLIMCSLLNAQFKTTIADSLTKIGLIGTTITIQHKNFATNKKGQVQIGPFNNGAVLHISHVGYQSKTILITNQSLPDTIFLALNMKVQTLAKVIAQKPLLSMSAGKITMNIAASGLAVGNHSWEILETAPGVKTTDDGSVTLLGKSVTIYIDGRPTNVSGDQLKTLLISMPAASIERIELISNPSARYQANGAAVINIITHKIKREGMNGTYSGSLGTSRYLRSFQNIDLNYRKKALNIYGGINAGLWGSKVINNIERTMPTNSNTVFITESVANFFKQDNRGFKLGLDYDISKKTTVGFLINGYYSFRKKITESNSYISYIKNQYDSIIQSNTMHQLRASTPSVNLFFKTNIDSTKELITNLDYYRYGQQWNDDFTILFLGNNINNKPPQYRRDQSPTLLDIYSITTDYTQTLKKGNFQAGFKLNYIKTDNNIKWELQNNGIWENDVLRTNYFIYKENVNAAYAGFSKTFKKFETEAILRAEQTNVKGNSITLNTVFTKNYINLFPSLSMLYTINDKNQLSMSYRKSIDRPSYQNVNPFKLFRSQFNFFEGNPDLNPTFTHSIELQHNYKSVLFSTITYNYIDQFTGSIPLQDTATRVITTQYANYTDAQQITFSIYYTQQVKSFWYTSTNANWSYFKAAFPGITPRQSTASTDIGSHNVFTLKKSKLRMEIYLYASLPYHDGFYYHGINSNCNLAISKSLLKNKATLRANCTNVFGINNVESRTEIGTVNMSSRVWRDSRVANLSFTYRFGNKNVKQAKQRSSKISKETQRMGN